MKLIVGLGNPGEKYKNVRHNLGFKVADKLVDRVQGTGYSWRYEEKFKSEICNLKTETYNLVIAKPQTYMNNSGLAAKLLVSYYKISPADVVVVHDDLDLPLGKIKLRVGGSAAGHHGVESIIDALGTDQFVRVRLGTGNEKSHSGEQERISFAAEEFVLEQFLPNEKLQVSDMTKQAVKVLEIIIDQGVEVAQNQFN